MMYCDNKGLICNFHENHYAGIPPFFNLDHNLVKVAQTLLDLIPLTAASRGMKGYYQGKDKHFELVMNHKADHLATSHKKQQVPPFASQRAPIPPPNYNQTVT
jgi:hypothetical protein